MALIKCPECGKEISDKAMLCPNCGYPIAQCKNLKKEEYTSKENAVEENTVEENTAQEKIILPKENVKISPKKAAIVGISIVLGITAIFSLTSLLGKNKIKIDAEPCVCYETSEEKIYEQKIKTNLPKDYVLFTENNRTDIWKGEGSLSCSFDKNEEDEFSNKITAIYEIKNIEDSGISLKKEDLTVDSSDDAFSIKIKTSNKNPFMLFYHYEDNDGKVISIHDEQDYNMKVITDSETIVTDYASQDDLDDNLDYKFIIDGVAEYNITEKNPKVTLGKIDDKVDTYSWEENSHYEFDQKIQLNQKYNGFLFFDILQDGEKYKSSHCRITDGTGEISSWIDNIEDISKAPRITYNFKGFSQTEYTTDFEMKLDTEIQPSRAPFRYIYERYNLLDGGYITLGDDEKYLSIDSNPMDIEDLNFDYISDHVVDINKLLCLPDVITQKMYSTSSMDGLQTKTYEDLTVSWKYHPDMGLEVLYEIE